LDFVAIGIHSCDIKIIWIKSTMPTASPDSLHAVKMTDGTKSPQTTKETAPERRERRKGGPVSWYGRLLIVNMLLVAAGWEIFRLILAIMTLD
jgi:hypothetical protein